MSTFNDYTKTKRFELLLKKINIQSPHLVLFWIFFALALLFLFKSITYQTTYYSNKNKIINIIRGGENEYSTIIYLTKYNELEEESITSVEYDAYIILRNSNKVIYHYEKESTDNYRAIYIIATIISSIISIVYLVLHND